jgi:hypothetical protein
LLVHIGDPPTNQAASLESQMIPTIQYVPGLALKPLSLFRYDVTIALIMTLTSSSPASLVGQQYFLDMEPHRQDERCYNSDKPSPRPRRGLGDRY